MIIVVLRTGTRTIRTNGVTTGRKIPGVEEVVTRRPRPRRLHLHLHLRPPLVPLRHLLARHLLWPVDFVRRGLPLAVHALLATRFPLATPGVSTVVVDSTPPVVDTVPAMLAGKEDTHLVPVLALVLARPVLLVQ